jgi:hypothetical protein
VKPISKLVVCVGFFLLVSLGLAFSPSVGDSQDYQQDFGSFASDGQDSAKRAFEKGNYPWYDAENDQANFTPDVLTGDGSKTANRQSIRKAQTTTRQSGNGGAAIGWLTFWIILIIVLFVGLVALAIWFLLKMDPPSGFRGRTEVPEDTGVFGSERVESLPFDLSKPSGDFRAAAEAAYRAGDYRNATTYLFSHVLLTLDRNERVRLRRGKTNRQYMSEMTSNGAASLTDYYEKLMVTFESAFFGNYELQASQFEESWNGLGDFQARLERLKGGPGV